MTNKKKIILLLFVLFVLMSCFFGRFDIARGFVTYPAHAQSEAESIEQEFEQEIDTQLSNLDFSGIEGVVTNLSTEAKRMFSKQSFASVVSQVISGEYVGNSQNFFASAISLFFANIKEFLPTIATIVAISILGGMIGALRPTTNAKSIGNIVHFVTYGLVVVFLGAILANLIDLVANTLKLIKGIFDAIFPILLTLLTAIGGSVSVGIYQPAIALLSGGFASLISYVLMPMFVFSLVFSLVGNLSSNVKLDKFVSFLQGSFKWTMGLCFTIFLGFVSIQGIMAGSVDGLSVRTAKYALKSYIPIVGGYVSDGLSIITASSVLIKNAIGGAGLFLLLSGIISPVLNLVVFMLSLRFMAGIIEPVGDKKIANFVSEMSKSMSLLIALLIAVSFMYLVLTGLVMCSANLLV